MQAGPGAPVLAPVKGYVFVICTVFRICYLLSVPYMVSAKFYGVQRLPLEVFSSAASSVECSLFSSAACIVHCASPFQHSVFTVHFCRYSLFIASLPPCFPRHFANLKCIIR